MIILRFFVFAIMLSVETVSANANIPIHSSVLVGSYEVPGALPQKCRNHELYTSKSQIKENEDCVKEMVFVTIKYLNFLPALSTPGVISEEMRVEKIRKAKEVFGYYNTLLLGGGENKVTINIDDVFPPT